jgi:hypothetical protein
LANGMTTVGFHRKRPHTCRQLLSKRRRPGYLRCGTICGESPTSGGVRRKFRGRVPIQLAARAGVAGAESEVGGGVVFVVCPFGGGAGYGGEFGEAFQTAPATGSFAGFDGSDVALGCRSGRVQAILTAQIGAFTWSPTKRRRPSDSDPTNASRPRTAIALTCSDGRHRRRPLRQHRPRHHRHRPIDYERAVHRQHSQQHHPSTSSWPELQVWTT